MSNISRLAPYAYLAKRSGGNTLYDLLLLVPVDALGDTDLSSVTAVKSSTHVTIDYTTTSAAAGVTYRFKHFVIDNENKYVDIEIQGDNNPDLTTVVLFADADTEPATVSSQMQTCAPYLFAKIETVGGLKYIQPSCVVLFDAGLGLQSEAIIFAANSCTMTIALGSGTVTTDPTKFVINQNVKAALTQNQVYVFEGNLAANAGLGKPPRKSIIKVIV